MKMLRPKNPREDEKKTSRVAQREAQREIAEHRVKVLRNSLVEAVAKAQIRIEDSETRSIPVNLEESEESSESSSSYSAQREDKESRFIHFNYLPSNLERFKDMKKCWYGFEKAMKFINLNVEVVEKQLKEGKPIYYDREETRDRLKRAYEVYIKPEPKVIKRIKVPTEEGLKKLVVLTTPKAKDQNRSILTTPWKTSGGDASRTEKKDLRRTSQANQGATNEST